MYANKSYFSKYKEDLNSLPLNLLTANYNNLKSELSGQDLEAQKIKLVDEFCKINNIQTKAEWFFQQSLAKLAELPLSRNSSGLISSKVLLVDYIRKDPILTAIWLVFKHPQRSAAIKGQTDIRFRNYCSLVPLIMSAFKKYKDVSYSEWDRSEISGIVDINLAETMLLPALPRVSIEEILETREVALTPKSGDRAGITRNPLTTYTLYIPKDSELSPLPMLAKIMMCQTWCANPANRTKYMILNPLDWDDEPKALIDTNVLKKTTSLNLRKEDDWTV